MKCEHKEKFKPETLGTLTRRSWQPNSTSKTRFWVSPTKQWLKLSAEGRVTWMKREGFALMTLVLCSLGPVTGRAEIGKASWYSIESVKKEGNTGITASGEKFRDMSLTCAKRSRVFGKLWKVKNLASGKSIVCRQNDFGPGKKPAKKGVIIDLSKGAFMQLADLKTGIIKVEVTEVAK